MAPPAEESTEVTASAGAWLVADFGFIVISLVGLIMPSLASDATGVDARSPTLLFSASCFGQFRMLDEAN